jgi:aryl-alcohol dehydrogenase-like predicted oxidoreductase/enamine deaminase RidA (YjgF/YER057c/UK114 family)
MPPIITIGQQLRIRRLIVGLWQMADQERDGRVFDLDRAAEALTGYARAGFDTFDMADHYGSAEIVAGMVSREMRRAGERPPVIATKWCPEPGPMTADVVRRGVERSLERLGIERIDLMQFHWWRYEMPEYMQALEELMRLREAGLIGAIGLTNFDADHLRMLIRNGIDIATNQVSISVVDRRATGRLSEVAADCGVRLLAYGTLNGGFLSARSLGRPEPDRIEDWSRMKYKRFIDAAGGWARFQGLLEVLAAIAARHDVSLSNVASRWVLDQRAVAATIIGVRLGEGEHRSDNLRALSLEFTAEDRNAIASALAEMTAIPGDCGDEYRRPPFLTASGDLSHHLDAMAPPMTVRPSVVAPARSHALSGSIWEEAAGFARAIRAGDRILVSGTTATDARGRPVCEGDAEGQTVFILDKILAAILSLGGRHSDVVRTRIHIAREEIWPAVSRVHARYFGQTLPANTMLVAGGLIGPYEVEIEAEAVTG